MTCQYCAGETPLLSIDGFNVRIPGGVNVFIKDERLICLAGDELYDYREISTCPMCGEPLALPEPPTLEQIDFANTLADLAERATPAALAPSEYPGIGNCPACAFTLALDDNDLHFCPSCGQAIEQTEGATWES